MNLRHTAVLALMGWTLFIPQIGRTYPKDCPDCPFQSIATRVVFLQKFKTKEDCEKAGQDYVRKFFLDAHTKGERIASVPSPVCTEVKAK